MRIRALHLTNVRKFAGKRASIVGMGDGITVVCEANEFGKSTFFDAINALFFERYGSSAKLVRSLQPYSGGSVEIGAEIETSQGKFLVEKRFQAKKMARIVRLADSTTIAQDDEAERWISTELTASGNGPAGLLWVRQGLVGLESESSKEKSNLIETRRDLLSSVAGEIDVMTGGRRMDRVMRRMTEDLAEIATKTGRKSGAWKAAFDEVEVLEAELSKLTQHVDALDDALNKRKSDEALLSRLDNPETKSRRDEAVAAAQTAMNEARAHAGLVEAAQLNRDMAALHAEGAKSKLDIFLSTLATLSSAAELVRNTTSRAHTVAAEAAATKDQLEAANIANDAARKAVTSARAELEVARRQTEARRAKAEAAQLADRIDRATSAQTDRDVAAAQVKASVASPDWLASAEAETANVIRLEVAHHIQSTTLQMTYLASTRIVLNGTIVDGNRSFPINGDAQIDLPGIGQMLISAQTQAAGSIEELAKARAKRDAQLSLASADTIHTARKVAASRAEAVRNADLANAVLATLAPKGVSEILAAKAEAELAAIEAHEGILPSLTNLMAALSAAIAKEEQTESNLRELQSVHLNAREMTAKARSASEAALQTLEVATENAGPIETHDLRRADLLRADAMVNETLLKADEALTQAAAVAPDVVTIEAELKRTEDAVKAAATQRMQVAERLAGLSAEIRTMAGNGIEERRDETAGRLETARANEARFARKVAALTRLQAALEAERAAAQETYFGPVHQELKPLLSILHRDAALTFDGDNLLPIGLTRGLSEEALDNLSGGTREQIAILTRLAFARLFARQGQHMPIILDDALVYSDDDRIIKMFTALTRVAVDQQIIVFSCRQLAFQDLGGARPTVQVCDA